MEQKREEEARVVKTMEQKKMKRSTTHDNDIPLDLIVEMLSRLPAKSIARCRSVSKLWSSFTTTPYFISSFATRSLASRPCAMLLFSKGDKLLVFSSPIHKDDPQVERYQFTIPNKGYLQRYDSVHGLIHLQTSTELMIWNPTMNRIFTLPKLECIYTRGFCDTRGFVGYDPIDDKYKALYILEGNKIGILALGGAHQESWRILSEGFPRHGVMRAKDMRKTCVLCIDGVIYYQGLFGLPEAHAIMSFDLRSEKFTLIQYPNGNYDSRFFFVTYEGRLALASSTCYDDGIGLWLLDNHQWIYKDFPSPRLPYQQWTFKGVTDAGEFLFVFTPPYGRGFSKLSSMEWSYYDRFGIIYIDPKKKQSLRQVVFPGIQPDDVKQLDLRRDDLVMRDFCVPNHIESLMSL